MDLIGAGGGAATSPGGERVGILYEGGLFGCRYEIWERKPWSLLLHKVDAISTGRVTCDQPVCFHFDDRQDAFSISCK